jgi:hypothetical protein
MIMDDVLALRSVMDDEQAYRVLAARLGWKETRTGYATFRKHTKKFNRYHKVTIFRANSLVDGAIYADAHIYIGQGQVYIHMHTSGRSRVEKRRNHDENVDENVDSENRRYTMAHVAKERLGLSRYNSR